MHGESEDEDGRLATNKVELAASDLFSIPGMAKAYHTSVVVNGEEFFFSDSGIFSDRALNSHQQRPSERVLVGYSTRTGAQLLASLSAYFRPGSYDLIHKNCNTFSDCALYFLLRKRLDWKYSMLERIGQRAAPELLQSFTKGMYQPNQAAIGFSSEEVIAGLSKLGGAYPCDESQFYESPVSACKQALQPGTRVTIVGLKTMESINGQGATIMRFNAVNGRWEAMLNMTGELKAFRAENLRPAGELVLQPGDTCRIHSLQSELGKALNGQEGEVVRYSHEVSRYEIRLPSGKVKALKAENLQVF